MREYSDEQKIFLEKLKVSIVRSHKTCNGLGYSEKGDACICMMIFSYLKDLYYSNIPSDYWPLNFDKLEIKDEYKFFIKDYIDNIDNAIEKGLGLMILGKQKGIGKTSLGCEIGKAAILKRHNVYYTLLQSIIDDKWTDHKLVEKRIHDADVIIIDEPDLVVMRDKSNIPKQFRNFLRSILPQLKAVIFCSNMTEEEFEEKFEIMSLVNRYIEPVYIKGKDFSEKRKAQWSDRLHEKEINYFTKTIAKAAKVFYNNKHIAEAKEYDQLF
jgi:DNA replication protein DnaC